MKCLIVIDMQKDFIDGALGTKEAEAITDKVNEKVRNFEGKVIFTRDTHGENYMETQEGKNLPVVHCIKDTDGWQLEKGLNEFAIENSCTIFDKPTFGSVELGEEIKRLYEEEDLESVELCGVCTDICVISNALLIKAVEPELPVKVDALCCAGTTLENHNNALSAMRMCQIEIEG